MTRDSIRGSSDRSILILTSLADWPKRGYALVKDIEAFAGVKLGAGTLYSALAELEQAGLVEALPAADRRRPYRITSGGLEFLHQRLTESARIAETTPTRGALNLAGAALAERARALTDSSRIAVAMAVAALEPASQSAVPVPPPPPSGP